MKKCSVCQEKKPLEDFYNSSSSNDGKGYRCKPCDSEARKSARAKSPGTYMGNRRRYMVKTYGMTLDEYNAMLTSQEGRCAICKTTNPAGEGNHPRKRMSFAVDHCHDSGNIRGLLCNACNRGLGFFKDSAAIVLDAFKYLCERKDYGSQF